MSHCSIYSGAFPPIYTYLHNTQESLSKSFLFFTWGKIVMEGFFFNIFLKDMKHLYANTTMVLFTLAIQKNYKAGDHVVFRIT